MQRHPPSGAIHLAIAGSLVGVLMAGCGGESTTEPVFDGNVVLVVVDSLRADHLGLYGYQAPTSPFLDSLAEESVVFERAWAPSSYTSQSVAAILTGRLPTSGGSIGLIEAQPSEAATSLPQHFRRGDYRTALVSNQPLLGRRGFTRGFEDIQVSSPDDDWSANDVSRRALQFVDDVAGQPFFLYVHYAEPHQPYRPTAELLERFSPPALEESVSVPALQALIESGDGPADDDPRLAALTAAYDAEVAAADEAIEALVAGLEDRGAMADTALVVTASQGEELYDHGYLGHAWTVFEEVLHVPLIVRVPGLSAQRSTTPVSLVDLLASLLTLTGLEAGHIESDGDSFLRWLAGGELEVAASGRPKIAELVIRERCIHRAVVDGPWKYISTVVDCPLGERRTIAADYPARLRAAADGSVEPPPLWGPPVREMLFNLADDPAESNDLAAVEGERLDHLRRVLGNYEAYCRDRALSAARAVVPAAMIDPAEAERLESLGYL